MPSGKKQFVKAVILVSVSSRRFFSASRVLGSRPGSVGVGVAGCPGCAWVFNRRAPRAAWSLACVFPVVSPVVPGSVFHLPRIFPGVVVTSRVYRGRAIVRVRGPVASLRRVAAWWSWGFFGRGPGASYVHGRGS